MWLAILITITCKVKDKSFNPPPLVVRHVVFVPFSRPLVITVRVTVVVTLRNIFFSISTLKLVACA